MCGIFAYKTNQNNATTIIYKGLKQLDYRGYDSWGMAILNNNEIKIEKHIGIINQSVQLPDSNIGIGHTRWATHGKVNIVNAHPHLSKNKGFALAHNGIVENFYDLKKNLIKKGFSFLTQTDTEVIIKLIEQSISENADIKNALRKAFLQIKGRNTVVVLTRQGNMVAARNGSPLVIGVGKNYDFYLSSDILSFADQVIKYVIVDNGQIVDINQKSIRLIDIKTNKPGPIVFHKQNIKKQQMSKQGFDHYMIKEIFETPQVIRKTADCNIYYIKQLADQILKSRYVYTIGSGTAGLAAAQIAYYLRSISKIPAISLIGAEAHEYNDLFSFCDLIIAPSQSGETADVLEVLERAKIKKTKIATHVNMPGSMMTQISDYKFMSSAGPEICVMSTKAFTAQIAWGYLVAQTVINNQNQAVNHLNLLAKNLEIYLNNKSKLSLIKKLAKYLVNKKDIFLLAKGQNLNIIKEGMIKIIEGSYLHAHALPAGDLKHYVITLMEKSVPAIVVISNDSVKNDVINAVNEIRARGSEIIIIGDDRSVDYDYHISVPDNGPTQAIFNVVILQLLAYFMAYFLGNNIDKPRHIAKSVTVK